MKTFNQRISDYEYFTKRLKMSLINDDRKKALSTIEEIKKTGLSLCHSKIDFISLFFLNSKNIDLQLFLSLYYQKSPLNTFNKSLILSIYNKYKEENEELLYILSFYKDIL